MTRSGVAWGLCGLFINLSAVLAQDSPPPLSPPALLPPATDSALPPASALPAKPQATRPPAAENRSLLVIPGVTAPAPARPGQRQGRPRRSAANAGDPAPAAIEAPRAAPPGAQAAAAGREPANRIEIPLTLEPIADDVAEPSPGRPAGSGPAGARDARRSPSRPQSSPPGTTGSNASRTAPALLGRFRAPLNSTEARSGSGSSITVEPRSDPAAEAAIRSRVQKQIQQAVGDRVRSVEVRVSGRNVLIRAQAARFWQRRGVRRSLETLAMPSGYRARVDMMD
jgi:hypothetical protein